MNDFREIDDSSKEKDNMDKKSNNTDEYEKVCFLFILKESYL